MAEQSEFERDLRLLESTLHQLESQYNMFFAGQLPKPPVETRARVEGLLRRYDRAYIQSYADRFRLGTLQTRFTRFCELWDRGIRAREEGRPGPFQHLKRGEAPEAARSEPKTPQPAAPAETTVRVRLGDDGEVAEKLKTLYQALLDARRAAGGDDLPFDRFSHLVQGQLARLGKAAGREVVFRVALQDGKVSFTAKASASGAEPVAAAGRGDAGGQSRK